MAGLNRDFLMPYLQNICSLHLVLRKIEQKMRKINYLVFEAENGPTIEPPRRREYVSEKNRVYYTLSAVGCVAIAFCVMFLGLNVLGGTRHGLLWAAAGIVGGVLLMVMARLVVNHRRKTNFRINADYTRAYEQYRQAVEKAEEKSANTISRLKRRLQELEQRGKQADSLLQMAYAVDLIPMAYRNIYYAVYLYEWICSSRSDDLNQALRSFDPETGKVKLEHIIVNQTDAILVHTRSVASQYKTFVMQKQQEVILRAKVADMVCDPEQREMYNTIVDVNLAAGAFFAGADDLIRM
jgi:hypothetical protein